MGFRPLVSGAAALFPALAYTRFSRQAAATGSHPTEETKIERHCGLLSWMCCPCTLGLICFCPLDKQEVFAADGKRVNELCHHTTHGKIKDSCKLRWSRWLPFHSLLSL